jgi:ParB family transcriptional regulator, chromosome partitioning protein
MGQERPRRLGRGLSALLNEPVPVVVSQDTQTAVAAAGVAKSDRGMVQVEVGAIRPSRFQPRRTFDQGSLERLADSIQRSGMMQPVVLRLGEAVGEYELVAGERRWRAAQLAGLSSIPAVIHALSDEEAAEWGLVENLQREDLNPIEKALAFRSLVEKFGLTHAQIAERVGLDRSSVANTLRLLDLEEPIRAMIESGRLTAGHGRALLCSPPGPRRLQLAEQASDEGWSVRRLERAAVSQALTEADMAMKQSTSQTPPRVEDLAKLAARTELERQLGEFLGTKVMITTERNGKRGRMMIEFYGLEHFDGLLSKFGFQMK